MTRLRVLGAISLTAADGTELRSVTAQPKRIALLAYLAMATRIAPGRRDLLLSIFWPDSDAERGRHSLRQALYQLRRALGEAAILSNGDDEIRVDPSILTCDAAAFEAALDAADRERALALYAGDLLPGLHVGGAPDFDEWVSAERERLRQLAAQAAASLSDGAMTNNALRDAVGWARRAFELAPFDEAEFRRYATALERTGDRGTALRAFEVFAERLQREVGVDPCEATTALMAAMRARVSVTAEATSIDRGGGGPALSESHVGERPETTPNESGVMGQVGALEPTARGRGRRIAVASVIVAAALSAGMFAYKGGSEPALDAARIAILPFQVVSPAAEHRYLSEGLVLLFGARLETAPNVTVADPNVSLLAVRRDSERTGVREDRAIEVARSLGAGRLLTGNVVVTRDRLVINAWLRDSRSGITLARTTADGPADSLSRIVNRAAAALVALGSGERAERLPDLLTRSPEALQAYLEGAVAYRSGRYETATPAFRQALELDSTFVLAAVGYQQAAMFRANADSITRDRATRLVHAYRDALSPRDRGLLPSYIETYPRRPSALDNWHAASRAATLAPELPEVWFVLGDYLFHWGDGKGGDDTVARAREAFRRALEADSSFAPALHHLAELEFYAGELPQSRRYAEKFLRISADGTTAPLMRWLIGAVDGDVQGRRAVIRQLSETDVVSTSAIARWGQRVPEYRNDAAAAVEAMLRSAAASDALTADLAAFELELNGGRPEQALRHLRRAHGPQAPEHAALALYASVYGGAVQLDTLALAAVLERRARSRAATAESRLNALCHLVHAYYARDDRAALRDLQQRVHAWQPDSIAVARRPITYAHQQAWCAALVDAATAVAMQDGDALDVVERLDSMVHSIAFGDRMGHDDRMRRETRAIHLLLVRMFERLGSPRNALRAARREIISPDVFLHADRLYEQGRLAARLGHREEAIDAWRKYLALRGRPEQPLQAHIDSVRHELGALETGSR